EWLLAPPRGPPPKWRDHLERGLARLSARGSRAPRGSSRPPRQPRALGPLCSARGGSDEDRRASSEHVGGPGVHFQPGPRDPAGDAGGVGGGARGDGSECKIDTFPFHLFPPSLIIFSHELSTPSYAASSRAALGPRNGS